MLTFRKEIFNFWLIFSTEYLKPCVWVTARHPLGAKQWTDGWLVSYIKASAPVWSGVIWGHRQVHQETMYFDSSEQQSSALMNSNSLHSPISIPLHQTNHTLKGPNSYNLQLHLADGNLMKWSVSCHILKQAVELLQTQPCPGSYMGLSSMGYMAYSSNVMC